MFRPTLAAGLLSIFGLASGQLVYTVQELRYPGGLAHSSAGAFAVSDQGVIGGAAEQPDGRYLPRLWFPDGSTFGPTMPNGTQSGTLTGLTEYGQIAGRYVTAANQIRGYTYKEGQFADLGLLPGYEQSMGVTSINDSGVVCGWGRKAGAIDHGFTWNNGVFTDLHEWAVGVSGSTASGINEQGDVVGGAHLNDGTSVAVAWWSNGVFEILQGLPSAQVLDAAFAVNRYGEATGRSYVDPLGHRAVIWRKGEPALSLGVPVGKDSAIGTAINDLGQVTGYADSRNSSVPTTAFLASQAIGNVDLRGRAGGMAGWSNLWAYGINNKGVIVGQGIYEYSAGLTRRSGFKLTPVSTMAPPSTYTVQLGKHQFGNVQSLATQDGDALRVCRFLVPNTTVPPVSVQIDGSVPFVPMNLWLTARTKMDSAGSFSLTVDMWDWRAGQFDAQDSATGAVGTQYAVLESVAKGDIGRYVGAGNSVRARLRVRTTGPTASLAWCADFDQAVWNAVPMP